MKKYDERETLFSRKDLQKNTKEYETFYQKNKSYKAGDDPLRNRPFRQNLKKSDEFKEMFFPIVRHNKKHIKALFDVSTTYPVDKNRKDVPSSFHKNIKEIVKYYGAADVGIVKLSDYHYYSHMGGCSEHLGLDTYNEEIVNRYQTAIVFIVPMAKEFVNRAPQYEELLTTEEAYLQVAHIGARLVMMLKDLGYKAMSNNSEYYHAPMVPLAYDAGLGDIGMCNHIVTKEYGNRVRIGAVFTTLELPSDHPIDFGLTEFCKKCALCLLNCPSKAITHKTRMVNGRQFYKFDDQKCFKMWINSGTDCGTCLSACPFSQGLDLDKVNRMKTEPHLMDELMDEYLNTYGRRVYIKDDLPIVKLEDDDNE